MQRFVVATALECFTPRSMYDLPAFVCWQSKHLEINVWTTVRRPLMWNFRLSVAINGSLPLTGIPNFYLGLGSNISRYNTICQYHLDRHLVGVMIRTSFEIAEWNLIQAIQNWRMERADGANGWVGESCWSGGTDRVERVVTLFNVMAGVLLPPQRETIPAHTLWVPSMCSMV